MDKENCNHKWIILREAGPITSEGHGGEMYPAVFKCSRCGLILVASEALQLSALKSQIKSVKHLTGFQKYIAIIALSISFLALVVSIFK